MPYQVSLVFRTLTDIFPCSSNSPMKMGTRYSAFSGLPGTSFSKNSLKPSSSTSRNSGVNHHMFMENREFTSTATPSASAPVTVFTMFFVSTTSVRLFYSSILQMPRVTPPLSDRVFFSTKPAIQDLPPFTRYSWTALNPSLP